MRTPEIILKDISDLETQIGAALTELDRLEGEEMAVEPEHRKMISELLNSDLVAKLPNQQMRDDALENYILNHDQYRPLHEKWLLCKADNKRAYRQYRFLEECMKNRRAELQLLTFGGN